MSRSPCRSRARRRRRRSRSSSGRSSTRRPAASSATARSAGATDLRLQRWWTTGAIRYAPADLAQSWTFRGGSSREDIFRTMSTGFNGTPMPSFARRAHARAAMGDHRLHRLALGERRAWLYQPRRRQARPGSDRSGQGGRELRLRSCGPLSDRRADHGARTRVPSARDQRHRSGDLRCGLDRPPRSMARHERGEDGEERAVASRAAGGGGGSRRRRRSEAAARQRSVFGDAEVAPAPGQARQQRTRLPRRTGAAGAAIRVLRRRRDPDSFAGADRRPQALLHLRRRPELGGSLVLRSGPPRSPSVHRQGKRGHRAQRHGRCHRCRELRPGRMVGHLQAAASPGVGRRVLARRVHADRLLGLGRVLARAWQQARSHGVVLPLRRARSGPIGRRPDGEDGAAHSRHRAGRDRLGAVASRALRRRAGSSAASRAQPAADHERELSGLSGGSDVQEHLRSRR